MVLVKFCFGIMGAYHKEETTNPCLLGMAVVPSVNRTASRPAPAFHGRRVFFLSTKKNPLDQWLLAVSSSYWSILLLVTSPAQSVDCRMVQHFLR